MNKVIAAILCVTAALVCGCAKPVNQWKATPLDLTTVPGLEDCKMISIWTGASTIEVVRCPGSTTSSTYQAGKIRESAIVVEPASTAGVDE